MDNIIYTALTQYYTALGKIGYYPYKQVFRLLVLCFFRDFVFKDYRGLITRDDYRHIEMSLNCLFGSNCLIPYPDYLKMGKLHIGEITEMAHRVKSLEEEPVLKLVHDTSTIENPNMESDIMIVAEDED